MVRRGNLRPQDSIVASLSSSHSGKSLVRATKEKDCKIHYKRKKVREINDGLDGSPLRTVSRKLSEGASLFKAVAGEQPLPES